MINMHEVVEALDEIERCRSDFERAHGLEDKLYETVLRAIAGGHTQPVALARKVLTSQFIDFSQHAA